MHANHWITLCITSSRITSLLLLGSQTAHSTFSIPVHNLIEDSCSPIDKNTKHAEMFCHIRLIIWDEAVMQHKCIINSSSQHFSHHSQYSRFAINVVDCLFQDVCLVSLPFGGITVVFGGDFHQTLPIVINGTCKDTVQATLQCSYLWNHIEVLYLHQNIRISSDTERETFS
jgi:PIF1-like helicase